MVAKREAFGRMGVAEGMVMGGGGGEIGGDWKKVSIRD